METIQETFQCGIDNGWVPAGDHSCLHRFGDDVTDCQEKATQCKGENCTVELLECAGKTLGNFADCMFHGGPK